MTDIAEYALSDDWERAIYARVQEHAAPFAWVKGRYFKDRVRGGVEWDGSPEGCWNWTGTTSANGYGQIMIRHRICYVHRLMYEAAIGRIPGTLVIDHICCNRKCCRPTHLSPCTIRENLNRAKERGS